MHWMRMCKHHAGWPKQDVLPMKTQCDGEDVVLEKPQQRKKKHPHFISSTELKLLRNGNGGRWSGIVKNKYSVLLQSVTKIQLNNSQVQFFHCDTLKPILMLHKSKYFFLNEFCRCYTILWMFQNPSRSNTYLVYFLGAFFVGMPLTNTFTG